jgi:X box-binding protein 1
MSGAKTFQLVARLTPSNLGLHTIQIQPQLAPQPPKVRTVVIETPLDQSVNDSDDSSDCETVELLDGSKKRRRLTNLTHDEKIMRRKLKNRVAAQTARDRKKQRMSELEEAITQLEAQNKQLKAENGSLRQFTSALVKENAELKQQMGSSTNIEPPQTSVVTRTLTESTSESAVLGTPQQWEQIRSILVQLTTHCLMSYLLAVGLIFSLTCSMNSTKQTSIKREVKEDETLTSSALTPALKWWGRHQRNWNPSMNS